MDRFALRGALCCSVQSRANLIRRTLALLKTDHLVRVAGSTGRRNTVYPYRQEFDAYGLPAT
jgi:hypothetical protein